MAHDDPAGANLMDEEIKPLLRGWSHVAATIAAVALTVALLMRTGHDRKSFVSVLIFGLSMIVLYAVSSIYHIGSWHGRRELVLRALDHANIFLLIAGTYTPICVTVLKGRMGTYVLILIWSLAIAGVLCSVLTLRLPRWASTGLYVGVGSAGVITIPELLRTLPLAPNLLLFAGAFSYVVGAVIYILRRPNPVPHVFGFHEIFHLFVIGGSVAFAIAIWGWIIV